MKRGEGGGGVGVEGFEAFEVSADLDLGENTWALISMSLKHML